MDETAAADLQEQQKRVAKELKKRKQAAVRARKDEEDRLLIAAGEGELANHQLRKHWHHDRQLTHLLGPRRAKEKALKEAAWYQAQGKKRPYSPTEDHPAHNDSDVQEQSSGARKEKRVKRVQEAEDGESDDEAIRKQSESNDEAIRQQPHTVAHSLKTLAKKSGKNKATNLKKSKAASVESDSSSPLDPDDELNYGAEGSTGEDDPDEDDTLDVSGMTEKEARELLGDEVPHDPSGLFYNDDGVNMASVRSKRSQRSSSEASRPPSSEPKGMFDGQEDFEEDEEPEDSQKLVKKGKKMKGPSKRDAAFYTECPTIVASRPTNNVSKFRPRPASNVWIESDQENDTFPEEKWPLHARLNPHGMLRVQNVHIRTVCRDAIKIVEKTLVTEHAWPELHRAAAYKRQVLLSAANLLLGKDKRYKDVLKRITKDDDFVKVIGKWVIDRLSHHRGNVRAVASDHIALFQLGIDDGCRERVKALMENDVYVYPGEWGVTEKGQPIWLTKSSPTAVQIYLNLGLIQLIRDAYFATPTGFGYKFKDQYVSSHPSLPEPELTIPLIALGATAFFAAIWEWREGKRPVKFKSDLKLKSSKRFDGNLFKTVFDRHVDTLTSLREKINTYHLIMSKIYSQVTADNTQVNFGTRIQGNALAVLDLSGLD